MSRLLLKPSDARWLGFAPCAQIALMQLTGKSYGAVLDDLRDTRRAVGDRGLMAWRFGTPNFALDSFPGLHPVTQAPPLPTDCIDFAPCLLGWPGHAAAMTPWAEWPSDPPQRWWRRRVLYGPPVLWDDPRFDRRLRRIDRLWLWLWLWRP